MASPHSGDTVAVAPSVLRTMNRGYLYRTLFSRGPITRPQLAAASGLSQPTVIAVLADFEREGLVRTAGSPGRSGGRPAVLYEANPRAGAVAAVDIGRQWVRVIITDLSGAALGRRNARNTADSAQELVAIISDAVGTTAADAGLTPDDITRTVIGSPGVFRPAHGRISLAANLPGWADINLSRMLTDTFGSDVDVENDANLAALGEHTEGAGRNIQNFVYLHIGTGVGMGLVLNGSIYRGATMSAGEVGYMPFLKGAGGVPDNLERGALEEAIAADAIVEVAKSMGMFGEITSELVFTRAAAGDPAAIATVHVEADRLAPLVASIASMIDPELIIFGGGVGQNLEAFRPYLSEAFSRLTPLRPNMTVGSLGPEAVLRGAVATGLAAARELVLDQANVRADPPEAT
ncbi:ROK family transcriptional regulator [Paramicrobacterium chengjingii]|uniref:ROK family transcriptional regulator n=1 Tax=Paramicrobacterium chengjingii TaxID=2769067 RepID=UPI0014248C57|nr:ROK family transcriptional regulator [Microbacterium chengjingii]